jgi:hypothetical protein
VTLDTSSCKSTREAAGLSGYWLAFDCSVTLSKSSTNVVMATKSVPLYKSVYYGSGHAMYEADSVIQKVNPNKIIEQGYSMTVPMSPQAASSTTATGMDAIGVSTGGVVFYNNAAAPGDSLTAEMASFDKCRAHPTSTGSYHNHTEPFALTYDSSEFIGVMMDGFPIFGKRDASGDAPTDLDSCNGHTGTTAYSTTATYHYHATDADPFLIGCYKGTKGTLTNSKK